MTLRVMESFGVKGGAERVPVVGQMCVLEKPMAMAVCKERHCQ